MCHAHELNAWLLSSSVFIIFEFLLSINKVIIETSPQRPSHRVNQMKHGTCAIEIPFSGRSYLFVIPPKLPRTGNVNVVFPSKLQCVVVRKHSPTIKYVFRN